MPPHGPASGKDTAPHRWSALIQKAVCRAVRIRPVADAAMIEQGASSTALPMHADHLDWSLPAHRRGALRGMGAA
ncbi:hypothetical protein FLG15_02930 [Xanthomonas phaseoli pv. dieffenbachiae]